MEFNPYAPPSVIDEPEPAGETPFVDGDFLVVRSGDCLPDRCVITNQPTTPGDRRSRILTWTKPFRLVLKRHECKLSFSISRVHRRRAYLRRAMMLVALLPICYFPAMWVPYIFLTFPIVLMPLDRLRVARVENELFWITGFREDYLDHIASLNVPAYKHQPQLP